MNPIPKDINRHWKIVQPIVTIHNEDEYKKAVSTLNGLIDEVGTNEKHPLYELLDTLGTLIHVYEERHHPIPDCSGAEVLQFLMEEHQLERSDLPELGTPEVVLKILDGKQDLTVKQIHALAIRFQVNPAVFL